MLVFYTNMQNKIQNVSFKSNIRFIPYKEYERLVLEHNILQVKEMEKLEDVYEIISYGATKATNYCLAGVLKNSTEKRDFLFHWYPTKLYNDFGFGTRKDNLIKIGEQLKKLVKTNSLKGFVMGGLAKSCDSSNNHYYLGERSELSVKLLNFFKKIFTLPERKKFTMFFAQKSEDGWMPESVFVYSKQNDTYYVNSKFYRDYGGGDLLDKDKIRNHFKYIQVADGDKVFIGLDSEDAIPNKFWNKNEFKKAA